MIADLFGYSPNLQPKIDLERFCHDAISRLGPPERITPEALAEHFAAYFNIRHPVTFNYQKHIAKKLGIHQFHVIEMPERIGGTNLRDGDEYQILINALHAEVRKEHTVFHEIYELIVEYLAQITPSFNAPGGVQLEGLANRFSASIFMPEENFLKDSLESGLDIVWLKRKYGRSYASALIHAGTVLARAHIPFLGLIYEDFHFENVEEAARAVPGTAEARIPIEMHLSHRVQKASFSPKLNCILSDILPKKGDMIRHESLAFLPFEFNKAVFIEKAEGFDFFDLYDCSMLIRPVVWRGVFGKIIITGVDYDKRHLFNKQLEQIDYHRISQIHHLEVDGIRPPENLILRETQLVGTGT